MKPCLLYTVTDQNAWFLGSSKVA
ncbi:hypothetical protein V12B01_13470 [Vibrio splendidus 12B01]|nr:hypothetical protein V12B01_13470 [Vibrio splendidus 12B01]